MPNTYTRTIPTYPLNSGYVVDDYQEHNSTESYSLYMWINVSMDSQYSYGDENSPFKVSYIIYHKSLEKARDYVSREVARSRFRPDIRDYILEQINGNKPLVSTNEPNMYTVKFTP